MSVPSAWTDTTVPHCPRGNRQLSAINYNVVLNPSPQLSLVPAATRRARGLHGVNCSTSATAQSIGTENVSPPRGTKEVPAARTWERGEPRGAKKLPQGWERRACSPGEVVPAASGTPGRNAGDGSDSGTVSLGCCNGRNHSQSVFANNAGPEGSSKHTISSLKRQIQVTNKILEVN